MSLDTVNTKSKFEKIEPKLWKKNRVKTMVLEKCLEVNHEKITNIN